MQVLCTLNNYIKVGVIDRQQQSLALIQLDEKDIKPTTNSGQIKIAQKHNNVSWKGLTNGGVTRSIALGIIAYLSNSNDDKLISDVVECITITDSTYEVLSGAIFIASFLCATLKAFEINDAYNMTLNTLSLFEKEQQQTYMSKNIKYAVGIGAERYIREVICKKGDWGFLAIESVPVIAAIINMNLSLKESILYSVNLGGDSDSISAIVGAIVASSKGIQGMDDFLDTIYKNNNLLIHQILEISDRLTKFDIFEDSTYGW